MKLDPAEYCEIIFWWKLWSLNEDGNKVVERLTSLQYSDYKCVFSHATLQVSFALIFIRCYFWMGILKYPV